MDVAHKKGLVYDTSVLLRYLPHASEGNGLIPPSVLSEVRDESRRLMIEELAAHGALDIVEPDAAARKSVIDAAEATGDLSVLSDTDIDVVALALEGSGIVVSDDYALQNVCRELEIPFSGLGQPGTSEKWVWQRVCSGCRRTYGSKAPSSCSVCGADIRRKRRKNISH